VNTAWSLPSADGNRIMFDRVRVERAHEWMGEIAAALRRQAWGCRIQVLSVVVFSSFIVDRSRTGVRPTARRRTLTPTMVARMPPRVDRDLGFRILGRWCDSTRWHSCGMFVLAPRLHLLVINKETGHGHKI
jgi:hypothetical protein